MKAITKEKEIEEVLIEDLIKSNDRGIIIPDNKGKRNEGKDELTKELIAMDAIDLGPSRAAEIHNIPQSSASKYADGKDVSEETRTKILDKKHQIGNLAVSKLMESLNLFEPSEIEKPLDHIRAARDLATISEKLAGNSKSGNLVIHFHPPNQKTEDQYEVIEVKGE